MANPGKTVLFTPEKSSPFVKIVADRLKLASSGLFGIPFFGIRAAIFLCVGGLLQPAFGGTIITNNLPANTAIININALQDGSGSYNGDQSLWYQPFYSGGATQLLSYAIPAGTYTFRIINAADAAQLFPALTQAQTNQIYSSWSYNSPWVSDYLVFGSASATNNSVPQIFDGSPDPASYNSPDEAYAGSITAGYYNIIRTGPAGRKSTTLTNSYTFPSATNLIFVIPDNALSDNHGGVSVLIAPAGAPTSVTNKFWTGAVDQNWTNANNWSPVGVPGANDAISVFTSGTINLSSPVTIDGSLSWSAGTFAGQPMTITSTGKLNLIGNNTKYIQNVLTNAGTVAWVDGDFGVYNDGVTIAGAVENLPGASWSIQCDRNMFNGYGNPTHFHNLGSVQKSAGTGTTTFSIGFNNAGTATVQSGTIAFNNGGIIESNFSATSGATIHFSGGTFSYSTVPVLSGSGTIQFTGGALMLLNDVIPNLQFTGGTISLSPGFQGGTITNLNLTGSAMLQGSYTVSGTLNCPNGVSGSLTVATGGVVNWSGGTISGELDITNGAVVTWTGGSAGSNVIVQASGLLNLSGGGTKYFLNVLTNAGTVEWLGGPLVTQNYPSYSFYGAVQNLPGALWVIQCDQSMYDNYGSGSPFFANAGIVQKTVATGTTTFSIPFNNAGTVTAQTGIIAFGAGGIIESNFTATTGAAIQFSGGAFTYSTVPTLTGPGAIQFTGGTLTLLNDIIPNLQFTGGTISLSPGFQGGTITNLSLNGNSVLQGSHVVSGTFNCGSGVSGGLTVAKGGVLNWSGGTITGLLDITNGAVVTWTGGTAGSNVNVQANGLLNLAGNGGKVLANVLTNAGTVEWLGGPLITQNYPPYSYFGAVENLAGALWDIQCDQSLYDNYGGGSPYFNNAGTVQKTAGTGTTTVSIPFNNDTGTLDVETGTISFNQNNTYGQTVATLEFGLNGPTQSGRLNIAGNINFDGTLEANLINGYQPQAGDVIQLVTYNSHAGVFDNLNLPAFNSTLGWQISYNASAMQLQVVSNANSTAQITGSVTDNSARAVTNVTVFAYTTNSSGGLFLSTVTDSGGNYSLSVSNGVWFVGLQGLPARGYNPVANQMVTISGANQTANFVLQPYSLQYYTITTAVNPPGAGTAGGDGVFANGSPATINATAITTTLPYYFANWTENGVVQSVNSNYTFTVSRDRLLTANFTLPTYTISAANNPSAGGTVTGAGTYFYGTINVLTAHPNYGYNFSNWTENGAIVATTLSFTNTVVSNRLVTANYSEANTYHVVTTTTSPASVATVTGAGTYSNGNTATITAPASVTTPPYIYTFHQYRLNGTLAGNNPSITKTFSTLDPTQMDYVAEYDTKGILPAVISFKGGFTNSVQGGFIVVTNPVPAATNYQIIVQFERSMDTSVAPVIVITNSGAAVQPVVPSGGAWFQTSVANDTYRTPFITFSNGMGGLSLVQVSGARDPQANQMATTNVAALTIDVTPPLNPTISLVASNSSSAQVSWSSYSPPPDLGGFRLYLSTASFSSVAGLTPVSAVGSGTRNYTFTGLQLDQPYYAAVVAVDLAGNVSTAVTPLQFTLASAVPPPVTVQAAAVGASSANVSWSGYNTSQLIGFAGFQLYYETSNFTSVAALTPKQTLAASATSVQVDNLDRTKTYYFAVVGQNVNNGFNPNVTTANWSDPYAGNISANMTIGGSGQNVVDILQDITVVNNAILTIPAGTTLRFAPGTGLTVQQGTLYASGTPLDPIIFTSANDQVGGTPATGDWKGIILGSGAGGSVLMNVFVNYGGGLTLDNCTPVVKAFTALNNAPAGLTVENGSALVTSDALLAFNGIGAQQLGSSQLTLTNSVIQNNGTNALAFGGLNLNATQNWWGSTTALQIQSQLQGAVDSSSFLAGEPLLTPAVGTSNNVTQVGSQTINLRLACRTAQTMRLSEDSTFSSVFFAPFTNTTPFQLSAGGGQKTIFAQFRSVTGQTSAPVSISLNYITAGPTITSFNLTEGEVLTRPLTVTGSATGPLGVADVEFYVDDIGQATNNGAAFSMWFDARNFSSGTHRVKLLARDGNGNIATLEHNLIVSPTPPPAPVITAPAADAVVSTNTINLSGTAEPFIQVRLFNSGVLVGTTTADAGGNFSFANVALAEGGNVLLAAAIDTLGSAYTSPRTITLDTLPPAQLIMNPPTYTPGSGLLLTWTFPATGKRASSFEVFWSTTPITDPAQATGHTVTLTSMNTKIQSLPTGDYYFYVAGYDALGHVSPLSAAVTFHYDAVPPSFNVAFNKPSPVGVGVVHVILTASEALSAMPTLTVQPYGFSPSLLTLSNSTVNTYEADINVTGLLPSGPVQLKVTGQDLAGNLFSGAPNGPPLIIDVTPPSGAITTAPVSPVQATNNTGVTVQLILTEAPQPGTTPVLNFGPPTGSPLPVALSGSDTNWSGTFTVTPAMGSGIGSFTLSVTDALANVGHEITSGESLEIYNTALPSPPGQPVHFEAASLSAGRIQLTWSNVPDAEIYRVYSETGTVLTVPTTLIADNVTSNNYIDLPAADGDYRYVVTASRRGSEGTNSIVRVALSDRTPPPAPTNVTVQLAATGLQISWQPGAGETPQYFNIYRNGQLIRTVSSTAPVIDNPPSGVLNYTIGADDSLGNEALSLPATIQMLVGAVGNLQASVEMGQAPVLSWTSSDSTAVGFNVYRGGIKQNNTPLTGTTYTDAFAIGSSPVTYAVRALNATNAESAARSVTVYPVNLTLLVNAGAGTTNNPPVTSYFDDYLVSVSNLTASVSLPLQQVELLRQGNGMSPLNIVTPVNNTVAGNAAFTTELSVPCATNAATQSVRVRAVQQTDTEGSSVIYEEIFTLPDTLTPGVMMEVSVNQLPLAGGLTPFNVRIYNRGYTPIYFVATRNGGSQPGDLYISVKNPLGQEVSRTPYTGTPTGVIFDGSTGYVMIPPGSSTTLTVTNVLVPEALASNLVTFQAVIPIIYDRLSATGQQQSGPLLGSMQSDLAQTPYYGTAQTDKQLYSGDTPVLITGQALDRVTGLPVPNVPLQIGFATRGYRWYQDVTTDSNGNYSLSYNVTPGLAGTLTIWAAHPEVVDQLNEAQITIYRMYSSPPTGDIQMSKNDTLPFSISVFNPGDIPLTGFTVSVQAYQMQGTNQVPITTLHGTSLMPQNFTLAPGQKQAFQLQLASDPDAPDNAIVVFTLTSAEGASTTFTGNITLLPAVPIVSVVDPDIGYVEVSLDRGGLLSRQVTIVNTGLKDLKGVSIIPPTNVTWMVVNLPASGNGTIPLPDLPVGGSNSFTVVFTPPPGTPLGFFQDKLTIQGTNAQAGFDVNLYARVTSSQFGAVQFYVDDILGLDVPNATVRLRNTDLQVELPPVQTDINGLVTVTNLQEGDWSWQISAPGYSGSVGTVTVIPDQTVQTHTRLNKSLVTINFTVTPVPFSDQYDITIEQTFETHVPIPVLVLTPTYQEFDNVTPGFQATFIVTAQNEGLVEMTDLSITGQQDGDATLTPLITYVPVLGAQQSVDIPFVVTYSGSNAPAQQGLGDALASCAGLGGIGDVGDFIEGLAAFAKAMAHCPKDGTAIVLAGTAAVTMKLAADILSAAKTIAGGAVSILQCIFENLLNGLITIPIPGISVGIPTAPLQQSVQQFQPIAGCFAAETRVLLADGTFKTIDQIKPGDVVQSGVNRFEVATVAGVYERDDNTCREIRFGLPGQAEPDEVETTDEHLFWVDGKGWVAAARLEPGDWLMNDKGQRVQIVSNQALAGTHPVYTLKLQGDTAFYANDVLVHDLCGNWTTTPDRVGVDWTLPSSKPVGAKGSK